MDQEIINKTFELAQHFGYIFIGTADKEGLPHLAAAGSLESTSDGRLLVSAWFCPRTMANILKNPHVTLVIWDVETDTGYQIIGESEQVQDLAVLNGFSPELEDGEHTPQVERQMLVRVDKILDFSRMAHTDKEI